MRQDESFARVVIGDAPLRGLLLLDRGNLDALRLLRIESRRGGDTRLALRRLRRAHCV